MTKIQDLQNPYPTVIKRIKILHCIKKKVIQVSSTLVKTH